MKFITPDRTIDFDNPVAGDIVYLRQNPTGILVVNDDDVFSGVQVRDVDYYLNLEEHAQVRSSLTVEVSWGKDCDMRLDIVYGSREKLFETVKRQIRMRQ